MKIYYNSYNRSICTEVHLGGVSLIQDYYLRIMYPFIIPLRRWEDVIRHGGQLMVDAGFTDPSYTEAMVEVVHVKWGHISLLAPGLYATCSPEHGAKRVGTALVTLEKPLNFGSPDNDPVSVALFLCCPTKMSIFNC